VKAKRVQVDEIWSFTAAKQKNVATMKAPVAGAGDTWTWTAIEAQMAGESADDIPGDRQSAIEAYRYEDVEDEVVADPEWHDQ